MCETLLICCWRALSALTKSYFLKEKKKQEKKTNQFLEIGMHNLCKRETAIGITLRFWQLTLGLNVMMTQ